MLEEAIQTSYQCGAQQASRQTAKDKIHLLEFPPSSRVPGQKKTVDWLYIDADEDHVALQFREKRWSYESRKWGKK